jgi:hypothetical protein
MRLALLAMVESCFAQPLLVDRKVFATVNMEMEAFSYSCSAQTGGTRTRARNGVFDYEHENRFTEHEHDCHYVYFGD